MTAMSLRACRGADVADEGLSGPSPNAVLAFLQLCIARLRDSNAGVAVPTPAYEEAREGELWPGEADTPGMRRILSAVAILVLSAAAADAQTCIGGTELRSQLAAPPLRWRHDGRRYRRRWRWLRLRQQYVLRHRGYGSQPLRRSTGKQFAVNSLFGTQIQLPSACRSRCVQSDSSTSGLVRTSIRSRSGRTRSRVAAASGG